MPSRRLVYLLYCRDLELAARLKQVLVPFAVERATSRSALKKPPAGTCAIVYGMTMCSELDVRWVRSASRQGPWSPPCVAVAPLSIDCLRRLHPLRSDSLRVLWADEAETRLRRVLEEIGRDARNPLWRIGLRLISDHPHRSAVKEVIERICGLGSYPSRSPFVPENSVTRLASQVYLSASTLSRYWRQEVPLRCSLKEFVSWAVLLWAVRQRSRDSWRSVARQAGVRRRTLERNCARLAGCTLSTAATNPEWVVQQFKQWVESVWSSVPEEGGKHAAAPRNGSAVAVTEESRNGMPAP